MMRRTTLDPSAITVIHVVRTDDGHDSYGQEKIFHLRHELLGHQKNKTEDKKQNRIIGMMVFDEAVIQGVDAYNKSDADHQPFKKGIMDDIDTKKRKCRYHKR